MFSLDNFETALPEVIVERGHAYFLNEAVSDLEELDEGEWVATVEGGEDYVVDISLSGRKVTEHSCDCPFEGPVCKHVVAVLFPLRGQLLEVVKEKKHCSLPNC